MSVPEHDERAGAGKRVSELTAGEIRGLVAGRRGVSGAGRAVLARAVSIDHDWGLAASSVDKLIAAVGGLDDRDLEAAHLLAHHLEEAVVCVLIERDTARLVAAAAGDLADECDDDGPGVA